MTTLCTFYSQKKETESVTKFVYAMKEITVELVGVSFQPENFGSIRE